MYTHLEDYIKDLFRHLCITEPNHLSIDNVSEKIGVKVHYFEESFRFNNHIVIRRSTKQKEWQLFGHEICHYLRHHGNQFNMHPLFIDLQEWQANYFAYHFCVPTFMLDDLKEVSIDVITEKFNVDCDFAARRLEMYENKIYERKEKYALRGNYARVR